MTSSICGLKSPPSAKIPDLYALRRLEASLGHDPEEAPATLIDDLLAARRAYGSDAVLENGGGVP